MRKHYTAVCSSKKMNRRPLRRVVTSYEYTDEDEDVVVVSTKDDMTDWIRDTDFITRVIEVANDHDYNQRYVTPESFADWSERWLYNMLEGMVDDEELIIPDGVDVNSLISDEIVNELREQAMSGDFSPWGF